MSDWNEFHGPNAGYVLELYEKYRQDPSSVDAATREFFEQWMPPSDGIQPTLGAVSAVPVEKIVGAANLAQAIRAFGHLSAQLDPLGSEPPGDPWLELDFHGVTEDDLRRLPAEVVGGPIAVEADNAWEAIHALRRIYSGSIGYDYDHVRDPREREWLRYAAECGTFRPPHAPVDQLALLERLTQIEAFEQFLHRSFPGKTRFSIEGLDMLAPILDQMVASAADAEVCTAILGMAHRGRLNILAHLLHKPYPQILAEFKDPGGIFTLDELGWTGDVKYHKGARLDVDGTETVRIVITMPPNPSHLEHVNPVVVGMARSAGSKVDHPGPPELFPSAALPVLIHGDAAFPAQGVVAETLNFSRLPGYTVNGTLHIIANNQLGYTTTPEEGRSTLYASDLAKGFEIPIIHVNADDPIACLEAARTAFAYRQEFHKDLLINLVGYRRYGHNEGDEPAFTQPLMYAQIENHPSVRELWARQLKESKLIEADWPDELVQERMSELQEVLDRLEPEVEIIEPQLEPPPRGQAKRVKTAYPLEQLAEIHHSLLKVPDGFNLNRKIARAMQRRRNVFDNDDEATIDWATAEQLSLASILADGVPIRFTGEDTARGTFSHRHAIFHDVETGESFTPLQALPQAKASFEIVNSPLSENAAVGFEFGYNIYDPKRLVIWEAQYGDFINSAQAMIDEFVVSARAKWEQTPSLVFLLPHGYEGQGPDHSSARLERFLQLAAQTNLRIANCTTAAQYFHLLRRQAALLQTDPLPLIVMTPKSLLRHPLVASTPRQLAEGIWQPVIDDPQGDERRDQIRRLVLCSGKIYVDLVTSELREDNQAVAIIRLEQLYPFPEAALREVLERYPNLAEVLWVQEEPMNMGAWSYVQPRLIELFEARWPLKYIGRIASSSPAEGSLAWHTANQRAIIAQALSLEKEPAEESTFIERG